MELSTPEPVFPREHWFAEAPLHGYRQGYRVRREIYRGRSPHQSIQVIETELLGTTLILEGAIQTSTVDEHIYHEMLVHPALCALPAPRRVLIIGGGDGGALRRVLEHPTVERAIQVELDAAVVEVCRRYLPEIAAGAFDDPRAELIIGDGARYLAETEEQFDAILVDSTDPVGPAEALFSEAFYRSVFRALAAGGVFVTQSGSPLLMGAELGSAARQLRRVFPVVAPYLASIPSYPGVIWSFLAATNGFDLASVSRAQIARRLESIPTRYYTPEIHLAAFALPADLARSLASDQDDAVGLLPRTATVSR
ncbi:MAG: polyamine aminopropyltransferase [Chloroflexota bacterium]|nr:polyamine aminopropyltransferase [Dehalococcoidia bacterium]MDW8252264.1 polyamine aminopropyltransferase [Chloroflexota bacterium]